MTCCVTNHQRIAPKHEHPQNRHLSQACVNPNIFQNKTWSLRISTRNSFTKRVDKNFPTIYVLHRQHHTIHNATRPRALSISVGSPATSAFSVRMFKFFRRHWRRRAAAPKEKRIATPKSYSGCDSTFSYHLNTVVVGIDWQRVEKNGQLATNKHSFYES